MTIIPATRPSIPTAARPATPAASTGPATGVTIDPIKLLKKHKWLLAGALGAGIIVGGIANYVLLAFYPVYSSSLTYECFPRDSTISDISPVAPSKEEQERFMATQVQVMLSDRTVDKTVSDPALEKDAPRWANQFKKGSVIDTTKAAKELKKHLSAGVVGQSNFIRVSFWDTNPTEVTSIIRLLGRTYERDRRLVGNAEIAERKQLISQAITDTNESISKLQRERQRIITDVDADTLNEQVSSANRQLEKTQAELVKVANDKEAVLVMRNQLEGELKNAMGPKVPDEIRDQVDRDPVITSLMQQVNFIESELLAMKSRLSETHPDLQRLTTRLAGTNQKLATERERLNMQEFYARLDRYRTAVQSLTQQEETLIGKGEMLRKKAVELTQSLARVNDIRQEIDNLSGSRARLTEDLKKLEVLTTTARQQTRVLLFQDAQVPKSVSFPKLMIMLPAGALLFFGLATGFVLLIEIVDQRVKSGADIAMIPRTRLLGIVPHAAEDPAAPAKVETVFRDAPGGVLAESIRQLRGVVLKRMQAGGHKSLVCMSGMPGSGATSVVANLAHALAAAEQKVLLIDANFRRPSVHRVLGLVEAPGLADVVSGSKTLAGAVQKTGFDNLSVLSAGTPDSRQYERLTGAAMTALLKDAAAQYDLILLDVAPAMVAGDAMGLANRCDASMLVVRALGEKRGMVARLRNELSDSRAEFLGVIVNAVRSSAGGNLKGNILATHTYQLGGNGKA